MAMSMKDFLTLYFRQLHFDDMPEAKKRQFDNYVTKDDFRGDMKSWRNDLLKKDISGNLIKDADGHYVHNDLPDGLNGETKIEEEDWGDFYNALYTAFSNMDNAKKTFQEQKDKERDGEAALKFLNKYFGDGNKVFVPAKLDNKTKEEINNLLKLLDKDLENETDVDNGEEENASSLSSLLTPDEKKQVHNLIDKPQDFDKQKNKTLLTNIVYKLNRERSDWGENPQLVNKLLKGINTSAIENALSKEKEPTSADIARLKSAYADILIDLYNQPKVFKIFSEYDEGKLSEPFNAAMGNTDFDGKIKENNFVKPKYDDTLDWKEKLQKKTKDLYNDTLKKYITAHRDHIYVKDTAKTIGGVISGLKNFNPNDGLDNFIKNNKDEVINKLQDKQPLKAKGHFEWFAKKIEQFQKNGKEKEVAGALRDGDKMNHLVETLAMEAIEEDKVKEAKTAMEVLKVMQQPFFSGRTMEAIGKTDFKLFSDPNLSFNKSSRAVQSVMNAADKTLGATIKGVVLAGTGLASLYNRRNLGFNHSGKLEEQHQEHAKKKQIAETMAKQKNLEDSARITDLYYEQEQTGIKNADDLAKREKNLSNAQKKLKQIEDDREKAIEKVKEHDAVFDDFDSYNLLLNDQEKQAQVVKELNEQLQTMSGNPTNQHDVLVAEETREKFKTELKKLQDIAEKLEKIDNKYGSFNELTKLVHYLDVSGERKHAQTNSESLQNAYAMQSSKIEKLEQKISTYKSTEEEIVYYENAINKRNDEISKWDEDHKDYYAELMGFWDFLQTGHTKNIWRLSAKRAQNLMDKKVGDKTRMDMIYDKFMQEHGYAA